MNQQINQFLEEEKLEFGRLPESDLDAEYLRLTKLDIARAQAHLDELPEADRRGLTLDTYRHFGCGYLPDWTNTKNRAEFICGKRVDKNGNQKRLPPPSARIIVPTPRGDHFHAISTPSQRKKDSVALEKKLSAGEITSEEYQHQRDDVLPKNWKQHARNKNELFCDPAAFDDNLIVIVEGEIDAMSIWQSSLGKIAAAAIMGCDNWERTIPPALPKLTGKQILVLLDADDAGVKAAKKLTNYLLDNGCIAVSKTLLNSFSEGEERRTARHKYGNDKMDCNSMLAGGGLLGLHINAMIRKAHIDFVVAEHEVEERRKARQKQAETKAVQADTGTGCAPADIIGDSDNVNADEIKLILKDFVHAKDLTRNDWRAVGIILHDCGFSLDDWKNWSKIDDPRYDESVCDSEWARFKSAEEWSKLKAAEGAKDKTPITVRSLIRLAKENGYKPINRQAPTDPDTLKARLKELHTLPPTKETIAEARRIVAKLCTWTRDKRGNPVNIKSTVANYEKVFYGDIALKGLFARDDFRQEIVFKKRAPWHSADAPLKDTWEDSDDAELRLYLAKYYAEMPTIQRTNDFVVRIARENSFHSIKEFFKELPQWDETPRAENLFVKFFNADDNEYTHAVTMHFLLGAIARAFYPGCDFQSVVTLQGAQGIGKSRLLRMLGGKQKVNPRGESWHVALRDSLDDSHAVDAMRRGWIVEIEEFAAAGRADVNAMKGVLSADDVTRRFAYERHAKTVKAHWVFVGTTNDEAPLRDQTGNRRFLPIKCHMKESTFIDGMTADYIRQVWAEAYHRFTEMFPTVDSFNADALTLPAHIQAAAATLAKSITQEDGLEETIISFLNLKIPDDYIWTLFSREERRKYYVNGCRISIDEDDLKQRLKNRWGKDYDDPEAQKMFDDMCEARPGIVSKHVDKRGDRIITFYGLKLRDYISPSEIAAECFDNGRKYIRRISEILSKLEGWTLGGRKQGFDPQYRDIRKVYDRIKNFNQ